MACDLSAAGTNAWELATRRELVQWIRGKYQPNFQRLEDLSTGAVYCQVLDSVYPGAVALERVKWNAAGEKERLTNFQVLQAGLERAKLTKCARTRACASFLGRPPRLAPSAPPRLARTVASRPQACAGRFFA